MSAPAEPAARPAAERTARAGAGLRRLALLVVLLGLALLLARRSETPPTPPALPPSGQVVFVDTEGWYRRTADEVAARTPHDLTLEGLPDGLPMTLGPWQGRARAHDPAVDVWFNQPDVSIERTYRRADGETVWLSAFGSRGDKSFHLFEHTPDNCYPLAGWRFEQLALARLPLGPRPLPVNYGVADGPTGRLVVFYFYVWSNPIRAAEHGVLSVRIAAPVTRTADATYAMLAEDFMPQLFADTLSWTRF